MTLPTRFTAALFFLASVAGCGGGGEDPPPPETGCNGHDALCARRFDEVSYVTTHNAFSVKGTYVAYNQTRTIEEQLEDGVRGLMLDTHYSNDDIPVPSYCHGPCALGQEPLVNGLAVITDFLAANPREVVTIIFESGISSADTADAFANSGLIEYVRRQPLAAPWPTLEAMITANERLVVFTDSDGGDYDWYLDQFDYAFQNEYAAESAADFTCGADRGSVSNGIFIMNHFLTDIVGMESFAEMVNPYAVLAPRVAECWAETAKRPNFVTVDFYEIGDVLRVVDELNGVAASGHVITGP